MIDYWLQQRSNARASLVIAAALLVINYWVDSQLMAAIAGALGASALALHGPARRGLEQAGSLERIHRAVMTLERNTRRRYDK